MQELSQYYAKWWGVVYNADSVCRVNDTHSTAHQSHYNIYPCILFKGKIIPSYSRYSFKRCSSGCICEFICLSRSSLFYQNFLPPLSFRYHLWNPPSNCSLSLPPPLSLSLCLETILPLLEQQSIL